jgi:hypothetical protein
MSHPDDSQLALVPAIMDILRSRAVRPDWARRIEILQEQLLESFEGKARPPSSSDLERMRPHTAKTVQVDAFAFSVKVRNEDNTFIDIVASGLTVSSKVYIKIFQLDIEVIFSKDPFLVAGRGSTIAAGSMFAAVVPHVVIEETIEAAPQGAAIAAQSKCIEIPSLQSSPCFFLSVECNGVKSSQTVFKRYYFTWCILSDTLTRLQSHVYRLCRTARNHHRQVRAPLIFCVSLCSLRIPCFSPAMPCRQRPLEMRT